ncbi:hypothetical protein SLA2020_221560 [Shorea laevis]
MDERLSEASRKGDTATLCKLLEEDPMILEDSSRHASVDTPLHIASLLGHSDFVGKILNLKPGFARMVNRKGYTSLHLASATGQVEVVRELLRSDWENKHELCKQKDRKGRTALHLAVIRGRDNVVAELISACPESSREVTDTGETILHLTVMNENGCQALRNLVGRLKNEELLNWKDKEGNTVLHLAAARKQHEEIKFLLEQPKLDVNAVNSRNLKALDILLKAPKQSNDQEILQMLQLATTPKSQNEALLEQSHIEETVVDVETKVNLTSEIDSTRNSEDQIREMRRGIIVMAVLIATVTFEVALNPSGGVWQDGSSSASGFNTAKVMDSSIPGKSIAGDWVPSSLTCFLIWDSIGFLASMSIIVALTTPSKLEGSLIRWVYVRLMMWVVIVSIHMVFLYGVQMTTPTKIFRRAVIAPFAFFYGVVGLLALRTGFSMVNWRGYMINVLRSEKKNT